MPELSIIVVNWNGANLLGRCLAAIQRWREDVDIEVLVFDNGSSDDSIAVLEESARTMPVRVLRSTTNLGYATPNNRAWALSRSEFCLLMNNDAVLAGSVRTAVTYMASHPNVAICQGAVLSAQGISIDSIGSLMTPFGFLLHPYIQKARPTQLVSRPVFAVKGAAMYVRRSAIDEIGLFDDQAFAYFEETDLCWRARLAGWDVAFVDELPVVYHLGGASSARLPSSLIEFHSFKNRIAAIIKNSSTKTLLTMLPLHILLCAALAIGSVLTGRPAAAKNIAQSLIWNARALPQTLRQRKAVQSLRRRPDKEVFKGVLKWVSLSEVLFLARSYQRGQKGIAAARSQASPIPGSKA